MNRFFATVVSSFAVVVLLFASNATGAEKMNPEIEALKKRVEELEKKQTELYHSREEKKSPGLSSMLSDKVSFGGLIEIESYFAKDRLNGNSSDITLATVGLGLHAELNENFSGHVLLLYEEDATDPMAVDEGYFVLSKKYDFGTLSLKAGKMYVPFGVYNSHFVTDPETLELGETNETAALVILNSGIVELSAGAFNGSVDTSGKDHVQDFVGAVTVTLSEDLKFGASYISDIADTDADITALTLALLPPPALITERIAGYGAFLHATYDKFTFEAEYIEAAKKFDVANLDQNADGIAERPRAYNLELAYELNDKTEVALRYEGNKDLPGLLRKQYGAVISYGLFEHVVVKLEHLCGRYDTGERRHVTTAQVGYEF